MKRIIILLWLISLSIFVYGESYVPGQIIVQLKPKYTNEENILNSLCPDFKNIELKPVKLLTGRMNIWLFEFTYGKIPDDEVLSLIKNHNLIKEAQFNHYVQERSTYPDDPLFDDQWALENTGQTGGLPDADIDAPEAWDINTGGVTALGDTIVLAIVDSGNYLNHEDLNFWKNIHEIPNNGIDDDGNGYIDDYDGWNAGHSNGNILTGSHGTHVSGIAGATGNNNTGVSGVNWNAKIMPIIGYVSPLTEAEVVEAYGYVLEMRASYNETDGEFGAFVVATNASFGVNYGNPANYPLWCAMYDTLGYVGVLSTGATMNINVNVDETGDMPTACDSDYLITVTNTTHNDLKNSSAAYGPTTIDLGAPGTAIKSTDLSNTYTYKTGTSMATPQVTGAIGLLFSAAPVSFLEQYEQNPSEVALLIKQYILDGVDPLEDLDGITVSGGRLNIFNSLLLLPDSENEVSGHITEDTTWDADTIKVVGDIFVDDAVTLTINPGVYVEFQGYYKIDVQGRLLADGANRENIIFTIADTTGFFNFTTTDGSWNGITFDETPESNDTSILNYCTLNYCKSLSYTLRHTGAALYFNNYSNVIISNCIIEFNLAYSGGGIACTNNSSPYIGYNLIDGNTATYQGGGIYCDSNSSPLIENNFIYSNQAYQGGAIYCSGSSSLIYGNVIQYNTNSPGQISAGGGIYLWGGDVAIIDNFIEYNTSDRHGGGIHIERSFANVTQIINNKITGNNGGDVGGGICCYVESNVSIINNLIDENIAFAGAGIYSNEAVLVNVTNNTICNNEADYAGGVSCYNNTTMNIRNNILWDNSATDSGDQISLDGCNVDITYNDIQGGFEEIYMGEGVTYNYENNQEEEPNFLMEGVHPYMLTIESICINNGTPDTTGLNLPEFDLAGDPRIFEGIITQIDIGAYEFQGDNVDTSDQSFPSASYKTQILSIYPNPFNPSGAGRSPSFTNSRGNEKIRILFTINNHLSDNESQKINLSIYNIKGQKIKTFHINPSAIQLVNTIVWDGRDSSGKVLSNGIYFSMLTDGKQISFRKMIIIK